MIFNLEILKVCLPDAYVNLEASLSAPPNYLVRI